MANPTLYDILEVIPSASQETIEAAYRSLINQYHPDRVTGLGSEIQALASARTKELNNAYDVLSDAARRAVYDKELAPPSPPDPAPATTQAVSGGTATPAQSSSKRRRILGTLGGIITWLVSITVLEYMTIVGLYVLTQLLLLRKTEFSEFLAFLDDPINNPLHDGKPYEFFMLLGAEMGIGIVSFNCAVFLAQRISKEVSRRSLFRGCVVIMVSTSLLYVFIADTNGQIFSQYTTAIFSLIGTARAYSQKTPKEIDVWIRSKLFGKKSK
jgi:hypothetical protein